MIAAQLSITVRDMPHSETLVASIRRKLAGLERACPRITSFRVTLEAPAARGRNGGEFQFTLDVRLPGGEVIASRHQDQDVYIALRDACRAARRQLREFAQRSRGAAHNRDSGRTVRPQMKGELYE